MLYCRKATTDDIPALIQLRIALLTHVMQHLGTAEITQELTRYFSEHIVTGDYVCWVAADGDTIVSTAGICFYKFPPNFIVTTGERGYILNVYTLPQYRRRGLARQLFAKLIEEAHTRGVMQVSLHTSDEGRGLYEQFQFVARHNEMVWGKHV